MKKTLAILLSLALVICMIPGTAFAETTPIDLSKCTIQLGWDSSAYTGAAQTQTVKVFDGTTEVASTAYDIAYTKDSVAVSELTGVGTYTVTVAAKTGEGATATGTKTATFSITPYDLSKVNILIDDQVGKPSVLNTLTGLTGVNYYYSGVKLTDAQIAALFTGKLTAALVPNTAETTYTVNFTVSDTTNYSGTVSSTTFDVVKDIATAEIRKTDGKTVITALDGGEYTASEKYVSGLFTLYPASGATTPLTYGTDYTVTYTEAKKAGSWDVTIKGLGAYGGTKTVKLNIAARNAKDRITYDTIADQTVNTLNSIEPVLRDWGLGTTLVKGTDYVIKSRSGQAGEKGSIVIDFTGNYGGDDLTITFNVVSNTNNIENMIVSQGTTLLSPSSTAAAFMYNGSSQPLNNINVYTDYYKKQTLSSYYYTISYEYYDAVTKKTIATQNPVDAKVYDVYVVGQNGYAGKQSIGKYTIPQYDMSFVTVDVAMGSAAAKPYVTVKSSYENIYFTEDKDYTVFYSVSSTTNRVYVTVTPTATGNLTGAPSGGYYSIVAKPITSCTVAFTNGKATSAYTGAAISVPITVKDGYYTTLTEGTHYTVTYKDALGKTVYSIKDAGTYTIEITGKGMYSGTTYLYYTVTGIDISYYTVTLKESSVKATGYSQVPTITGVKSGYYSSLKSSDYTVTYKNSLGQTVTSMSAPDTYTVVVTGKNGYQGSTTATFRIVGLEQEVTIANGTSKKVYADSDAFQINAKASGDGTGFVWTTSDPTVATVSATGKVTIVGVGRAKITATTIGTKKYDPAEGSFIVKVYPDKVKQTKKPWTDGKKGQLKVRWGYQDGVTKYQIRYSTTSSFKSYTTKTVNAHGDSTLATQSTTLKNLKSGKKYYIKVRAVYQMYNEEGTKITYYGAWSPWKSGTTK